MPLESKEGYQSKAYQRTAEIKSQLLHGLDINDRYNKEVDFVIRSAEVEFGDNDKILDFACGAGEHAKRLSERLGVEVDARDYSEELINIAQSRLETDELRSGVKDRISFAMGNMMDAKSSIKEGSHYKMITILGSSFQYLGSKASHEKALRDFFDILDPGGKMVIQFYNPIGETDPEEMTRRCEMFGGKISYPNDQPAGKLLKFFRKWKPGKYATANDIMRVLTDEKQGDGFYEYRAAPKLKEDELRGLKEIVDDQGKLLSYNDTDGNVVFRAHYRNGQLHQFTDQDGIMRVAMGRAYFDKEKNEENLGVAQFNLLLREDAYNKALKAMIEKAGFQNVRLEKEALSTDGKVMQYVVVAEKV